MNSNQNIDAKRVNEALETLREKVEGVNTPGLRLVNSQKGVPSDLKEKIWNAFIYGEYYVKKLISDYPALTTGIKNKSAHDYYNNEYRRFVEEVAPKYIDVSKMPDREWLERDFEAEYGELLIECEFYDEYIGELLEGYEKYVRKEAHDRIAEYVNGNVIDDSVVTGDKKIKKSFGVAVDAINRVVACHRFIDELCDRSVDVSPRDDNLKIIDEHVRKKLDKRTREKIGYNLLWFSDDAPKVPYEQIIENCTKVANRAYFKPDEWVKNEDDLSRVVVERRNIAMHVRFRLDEIFRSYVFGNFMSAIALSRCLLEYSLKESEDLLKAHLEKNGTTLEEEKKVFDVESEDWTEGKIELGKRISIASMAFPELKEDMRLINRYGNEIMHPKKRKIPCMDERRKFQERTKSNATASFNAVNKIMSVLYGNSK